MFNEYISSLSAAIKIRSISTDNHYGNDIKMMAEWCEAKLKEIGFKTEIFPGYGNPIVYGKLDVDDSFPTVLHYGHYDVQPASMKDGWLTEPFELTEKDNRVYARGAIDNKGQFIVYLTAISRLVKENKLRYNVVFVIEGNEETGSGELKNFIVENKNRLKADFALISDGEIIDNQPTIDISYRGSINAELTVHGPKNDVHSGIYGGTIPDPINVLADIVANITNYHGLPHKSLKNKISLSLEDDKKLKSNTFNNDDFTASTGLIRPIQKTGHDFYKTLAFENVVLVTGIKGGYSEEGFRNSIPAKASAKINIRISANLTPEEAMKKLEADIKSSIPKGVKYELVTRDKSHGVKLPSNGKYFKIIEKILKDIYQKKVFYNYCGATLPIAYDLSETLGTEMIFVSLGNSDCNMHGPNENFKTDLIKKGLEFAYKFLGDSP